MFFNAKKNYHALAVKYEWPAGAEVNRAAASNPLLFPQGLTSGFNGDKFQAHVTIAYIDGKVKIDEENLKKKFLEAGTSFFNVTVKGPTLEFDMKPVHY